MSKLKRQQAIKKNQPIQIQWFTQDICEDYPGILTNYDGFIDDYLLQGHSIAEFRFYLAQQLVAGNITWTEASHLFPFFPYFGDGPENGWPLSGGSYGVNALNAVNFMYEQHQSGTLNFSQLGNAYGGPPEPVGLSATLGLLGTYQKFLAWYVMITNPVFNFSPAQGWTSILLIQEVENFFNQPSSVWLNCSLYDEPDPGEPPIDYSIPYPYNGDPCDPAYSGLINPETGNYYTGDNFQQITDTFYLTIEQYGQVGATYFFPDLNNDGLITIEDLLDLFTLMPITCPYELAPPPTITDSATMAKAPKVEKSNKGKIVKTSTERLAPAFKGLENLYTNGNEYTLPNGEIYVGAYHIHPTSGAMVGPKHTSSPHAKLTKLPPLKAQIPARSKGGETSKKQITNQQNTGDSSSGY